MKTVFLLIFLFILKSVFSQITDTTCIKSRWLALKNDKNNQALFDTSKIEGSLNIYETIRELALTNKLKIYDFAPHNDYNNEWDKVELNYFGVNCNSVDNQYESSKTDFFEIKILSISPLINIYGEDSVSFGKDGNVYYKYPPPNYYRFNLGDVKVLRIKEEKIISDSGLNEFKPVSLSFYIERNGKTRDLFWIDLEELFSLMKNKTKPKWYKTLVDRNYSGFQYMQTACDD